MTTTAGNKITETLQKPSLVRRGKPHETTYRFVSDCLINRRVFLVCQYESKAAILSRRPKELCFTTPNLAVETMGVRLGVVKQSFLVSRDNMAAV